MNINPTKGFFIDENDKWEQVAPGLNRQILGYDDHIMLVKARFEKGAVGALHHHIHSQVTYVESGVFEMTIDGEVRTIQKGDSFYVRPNLVHGCVCLEKGTLIDVFSPAREDFLT